MQDFPLKKKEAKSQFEDDLVQYMDTMGTPNQIGFSATSLRRYDFSSAEVVLIASVPGTLFCNYSLFLEFLFIYLNKDIIEEGTKTNMDM